MPKTLCLFISLAGWLAAIDFLNRRQYSASVMVTEYWEILLSPMASPGAMTLVNITLNRPFFLPLSGKVCAKPCRSVPGSSLSALVSCDLLDDVLEWKLVEALKLFDNIIYQPVYVLYADGYLLITV